MGEEGRRQQQQAASGCRRNAAAHASAAALAQTMAALLSIPSERPRWRFPPSANKGPGHPACPPPPPPTSPNISPSSLPSPHQLTSPQAQLRKLRASHHPLPPSSFSSTSTPPPPPRWRPLQSLGFHHTVPLSKNRGFSLCSQSLLSHFLSFLFLPVIYL